MDSFIEVAYIFGIIVPILIVILSLIFVYKGVNVVPQSEVYVIERFGKYTKTLKAGLNLIIPFLLVSSIKRNVIIGNKCSIYLRWYLSIE